MDKAKFATAINCMDGRVQVPVIEWLKKYYKVDYVDMITEPGPNKILAERTDSYVIDAIRKKAGISVDKHASKIIAVIGHHDCAGNPECEDVQISQIVTSIETIISWELDVKVLGLWINEDLVVREIKTK